MSASRLHLAVAQVSSDGPEIDRAEAVTAEVARQLQGREVDLVVLPELWCVGAFRPRTWPERAEALDGPTVSALARLARDTGAVVHGGSLVERAENGALYNTSVVLHPSGEILGTYRKIHRFAAGGLEGELLTGGDEVVVLDLPTREGDVVRTGLSTCYDLRFPELYRAQADAGAELLLVPAAWPRRRIAVWDLLLEARAVENQCVVVGVDTVGLDGRTPMGGRSRVLDAWGVTVLGPLAGAAEEGTTASTEVAVVEVDLDAVREARDTFPVLPDRRMPVSPTPSGDASPRPRG